MTCESVWGLCLMLVNLWPRSKRQDWTRCLCTTTGSDTLTEPAQPTDPFPGSCFSGSERIQPVVFPSIVFRELQLSGRKKYSITIPSLLFLPSVNESHQHLRHTLLKTWWGVYFVILCVFFLFVLDRVGYLTGAGSDYAAFVHYLGIASMDISYTYDRVGKTCRSSHWVTRCHV